MRAILKEDYQQYREGQMVKGATAKVLVAAGVAEKAPEGGATPGGKRLGVKTHGAKIN